MKKLSLEAEKKAIKLLNQLTTSTKIEIVKGLLLKIPQNEIATQMDVNPLVISLIKQNVI